MSSRLWWFFGLAGLAIGIGSLFLPPSIVPVVTNGAAPICVLATVAGILWHRPRPMLPWGFLAAAFAVMIAGAVVGVFYRQTTHETYLPLWIDLFFFAGYLLFARGLLLLLRARAPGRDLAGLLDALIVATSVGSLAWIYVIDPYFDHGNRPLSYTIVAIVYPMADLILFNLVLRLVLVGGLRNRAIRFLLAGASVMLSSSFLNSYRQLEELEQLRPVVEAGWFLAGLMLAVAALHPEVSATTAVTPPEHRLPAWWRIALLAAAAVLGPAVLAAQAAVGGHVDVEIVFAASLVLFVLVTLRIADLVRTVSRAERRFRALVQNGADLIGVVGLDGTIYFASPSVKSILGYDPCDLIGANALHFIHADDRLALERVLRRLVVAPDEQAVVELRVPSQDGVEHFLEAVAVNRLSHPEVGGFILTARDVSERKRLEARLQHQALHDTLTELPNRALFADRLHHALARSARSATRVAVLMVDLDNFKVVNDSLGHQAGDDLLVVVARRLSRVPRAGDTVARLGGDEFVILLEDVRDPEIADGMAERVLTTLADPVVVGGQEVAVSASVGIAVGVEEADLLRRADLAMYEAKRKGKSGYARYEASLEEQSWTRLQRETDLRRALVGEEFLLHYQPLVDLESGQVFGVEALVRWQHPEHGMVAPGEFIPLAEETGLIVPLGRWVLREACRQVHAWGISRESGQLFTLAVNLSARQFRDPSLVDDVARSLHDTGFDPARLRLEITETAAMEDLEASIATMHRLKDLGVGLEIDDFGTGYSGLGSIKRCPVDTLKIDRGFIAGLGLDPNDTAIVRTVIALARLVGLEVTAEGIETLPQVEALRSLGCRHGQGYLFARPLSADELETALRSTELGADLVFARPRRAVA